MVVLRTGDLTKEEALAAAEKGAGARDLTSFFSSVSPPLLISHTPASLPSPPSIPLLLTAAGVEKLFKKKDDKSSGDGEGTGATGGGGEGGKAREGEKKEGEKTEHQEKKGKAGDGMSFTTKKKSGAGEGRGKGEDTRSKSLNAKNTKLLSFEDE